MRGKKIHGLAARQALSKENKIWQIFAATPYSAQEAPHDPHTYKQIGMDDVRFNFAG